MLSFSAYRKYLDEALGVKRRKEATDFLDTLVQQGNKEKEQKRQPKVQKPQEQQPSTFSKKVQDNLEKVADTPPSDVVGVAGSAARTLGTKHDELQKRNTYAAAQQTDGSTHIPGGGPESTNYVNKSGQSLVGADSEAENNAEEGEQDIQKLNPAVGSGSSPDIQDVLSQLDQKAIEDKTQQLQQADVPVGPEGVPLDQQKVKVKDDKGNIIDPQTGQSVPDLTNAPEYARTPAYTTRLPKDHQTYLQHAQEGGYYNGVEFKDLSDVVGDVASTGIAPRYWDVLSRALVTKNTDKTGNWTHFGENIRGGAGRIESQMGELMTMAFSSLDPERRGKVADVIRSQIKAAEKSGNKSKDLIVNEGWLDAALNNAAASDDLIATEFPGSKVIGGAWDNPDELQALGIGTEGGEPKGFSTDIVLRTNDGRNVQVSLKKDSNVNFLNSGAGKYTNFILNGASDDPDHPLYETAQQFNSDVSRVSELYDMLNMESYDGSTLPTVPSQKDIADRLGTDKKDPRVKEIHKELSSLRDSINKTTSREDIVPQEYNIQRYNREENASLDSSLNASIDKIKSLNPDDFVSDPKELFKQMILDEEIPEELHQFFMDENGNVSTDPKTGNIKFKPIGKKFLKGRSEEEVEQLLNAYESARGLLTDANEESKNIQKLQGQIHKRIQQGHTWESIVDDLHSGKLTGSTRELNKMKLLLVMAAGGDVAKEHKRQMYERSRSFASSAIKAIQENPVLAKGIMNELRSNFPIRDVAEGKEYMVIGDTFLSPKIMKHVFGTTDFDTIRDRLVVRTDHNGVPYLGYQAEVDANYDGKPERVIPISDVSVRPDGLGYGNTMKHEMKLRQDFYELLRNANAQIKSQRGTVTEEYDWYQDVLYICKFCR
jgi:hypothetical protein